MRTPKGVWGPLRVIWGPQVGYGDIRPLRGDGDPWGGYGDIRTPKEIWGPLRVDMGIPRGIWGHEDP